MNDPQYITPKGTFVSFPSDYHSKTFNRPDDFISLGRNRFLQDQQKHNLGIAGLIPKKDNPFDSLERIVL